MQFTDIEGNFKNVAITSSQLEKALGNDCMFDCSIEKTCLLIRVRRRSAVLVCIEQEKFTLRPHIEGISHIGTLSRW